MKDELKILAIVREIENAALERAAMLCDGYAEAGVTGSMMCAAAIRAMKMHKEMD